MEWDKKVEMVKLSNKNDERFFPFVLDNISTFDEQAWDMFFTCIDLSSSIAERAEFWNIVYTHTKNLPEQVNNSLSIRTATRVEYFLLSYEDYQSKN